ncbi:MFS transporter [Erythrobacter sp. LQ02-29]|uniref:MFS transporter n=1 Tax=Erythrobacter sp. LQ02-29 TaxID=2920384 RepID=UPI001F4D6269|nr:MFS transporter [Erythrobacter sp. LQ02-29]
MSDSGDGLPMPRRIWAIAAISFGTALFVVDGAVANVALPTIARDLNVSDGAVTSVVTVYQLVMVMVLLPFATIGDRIGHRNLYQIGQVLFFFASAAALLVNSFTVLMIVRALQALGAGIALSVSAAMLRSIYPAKSLGSGLGINSVIVATSYAVAPTLGGFIVEHIDWRWVFVAAAPLALLSLLIGRFLPDPEPRPGKVDWLSGLWNAGTVALLIGGLTIATHDRLVLGGAAVLAGIASAYFLYRRERGMQRPVLPVDLMRKPAIGLSVVAAIAAFIGSAMLIVGLPFRFEQGMGYSPDEVGLLIAPFPLTMLFVAPAAGWLSDHVSPSIMGVVGMFIVVVALLLLTFMPEEAGAFGIAWRLSLCALGYGLFLAPNSRLMIGEAPKDRSAAAGGLLSTARLFGQSTGAAVVGVILAIGMGLGPAPLLVSAGFAVLAAICSAYRFRATGANLVRRPRHPDTVRP